MSEFDNASTMPDESAGVVTTVADAIGGAITGIPAPVKRAAWETFKKLATGAADVGVAKLEGYAQEIRAATAVRVKLIEASGSQIARQIDVEPGYGKAASDIYAAKIIRRQINVDETCKIAAEELVAATSAAQGSDTAGAGLHPSVSEDWVNAFDVEAGNMSTEQMQRLFGKILAGEIVRPGSFSIRTLKIMAQLDNKAALLFTRLCSLSTTIHSNRLMDARVVAVGERPGNNGLQQYGLRFADLNLLAEYGLITPNYVTSATYDPCVAVDNKVHGYIRHQNKTYVLEKVNAEATMPLKVSGVAFSSAGRELLPIVETDSVPEYTEALVAYFQSAGFKLEEKESFTFENANPE